MKLVIASLAFLIVVISGAKVKPTQESLNDAYNSMKASNEAQKLKDSNMLLKQDNFDCIKATLKLSENGNKVMSRRLASDYVMIALLKCYSDEGQKEFFVFMLETLVYNLAKNDNHRCNKVMLQKLDPTSKLVENFDKTVTNEEVKACDTPIPTDKYEFVKNIVLTRTGSKPCYEDLDIKTIYYLVLVMKDEKIQDLIDAESSRYAEGFRPKFAKFLTCTMNDLMAKL
ncbi:hypothetical protein ACKWTF_014829 [Chironomus riparius]